MFGTIFMIACLFVPSLCDRLYKDNPFKSDWR